MERILFRLILRVDSYRGIRYRLWRLGEENSGATELDEMERSHIRDGRSNYDTRLCGTESLDFITEVRALGGEISGWAVVLSLGRDG